MNVLQSLRYMLLGVTASGVVSCAAIQYATTEVVDPSSSRVVIPDATTAVRVGEAILISAFGAKQIRCQRPFRAVQTNGTWEVTGTVPPLFFALGGRGGVAVVQLNMADGRVLRLLHTK